MKKIIDLAVLLLAFLSGYAQHHHDPAAADTAGKRAMSDTMLPPQPPKAGSKGHMHSHSAGSHAFSLYLPMNRNASGTSWNPDASPMYMWWKYRNNSDWMFHGSLFLRYAQTNLFENDKRGSDKWSTPNWFMAMMNYRTGQRGLLNLTAMLSLDRITDGGRGYPLLFQSGETWKGRRLIDRQHPHDLFSALSIAYTHAFSKDLELFGYAGYPGEPALGAPAFMHRVSAINDPDAPLSHHWQDATHISFGVATLGFRYRMFKLEGSVFNGKEPDEERFGLDPLRLNSYAYRVSYNPGPRWAMQASRGHIRSPEALEPGVNVERTTASVLYASGTVRQRSFNGALIWGMNDKGSHHREHSLLLEGNYRYGLNRLFGRYEYVQKSADELDLEKEIGHVTAPVQSLSLGYARSLFRLGGSEWIAGAKATLGRPGEALRPYYGNYPLGFQLYLQVMPALHNH